MAACVGLLSIASPALAVETVRPPLEVSPVGAVAAACPSFSWSAVAGAAGYQLLVYGLSAEGEIEARPAISTRLPAGSLSWTPPADKCLERGGYYVWWIRSLGGEAPPSGWSEGAVIEVAAAPSISEVERALATLELYRRAVSGDEPDLDAEPERRVLPEELARRGGDGALAVPADFETVGSMPGPTGARVPAATRFLAGGGPAALAVEGEVRSVDSGGDARLWGEGREGTDDVNGIAFGPCSNGSIRFGLTTMAVDWGSAASACPVGTWVCERDEVVACNTDRLDDGLDGLDCDGTPLDYASNEHLGWVEDAIGGGKIINTAIREGDAMGVSVAFCASLPVWCCWEP